MFDVIWSSLLVYGGVNVFMVVVHWKTLSYPYGTLNLKNYALLHGGSSRLHYLGNMWFYYFYYPGLWLLFARQSEHDVERGDLLRDNQAFARTYHSTGNYAFTQAWNIQEFAAHFGLELELSLKRNEVLEFEPDVDPVVAELFHSAVRLYSALMPPPIVQPHDPLNFARLQFEEWRQRVSIPNLQKEFETGLLQAFMEFLASLPARSGNATLLSLDMQRALTVDRINTLFRPLDSPVYGHTFREYAVKYHDAQAAIRAKVLEPNSYQHIGRLLKGTPFENLLEL